MNYKIYIDSANLHETAKRLGYRIDYKILRVWLTQKYGTKEIILYMGLIPGKESMYNYYINTCGYRIVFKETVKFQDAVKGNCDGELILDTVRDYYEHNQTRFMFIAGDGDFSCLFRFLLEKKCDYQVLAPNYNKCSILIKKIEAIKITFLNEHYLKFSQKISIVNEKAPDNDSSL